MKRIAIYCVTYHSYKELANYLQSLEAAQPNASEYAVDVFISDNTDKDFQEIATNLFPSLTVKVFPFLENLGYFGAIGKMMQQTDVLAYDFVVLSNVDVTVDKTFFKHLGSYPQQPEDGWLAPAIISRADGCDLNPQATTAYPLSKLKILLFLYRHPLVNTLYERTAYRVKRNQQHPAGEVYAGHGSFIILTHEYFVRCGIINYPVFLYGEELYLGEQCRRHQLKVQYVPSIKVSDIGAVSTGQMRRDFYYQCNAEAIQYIMNTYY